MTNTTNFSFDFNYYNTIKPYVFHLLSFFLNHKIKKVTHEDCFQISMTLFQTKLDLDTINKITDYTYYITQTYPDILTK